MWYHKLQTACSKIYAVSLNSISLQSNPLTVFNIMEPVGPWLVCFLNNCCLWAFVWQFFLLTDNACIWLWTHYALHYVLLCFEKAFRVFTVENNHNHHHHTIQSSSSGNKNDGWGKQVYGRGRVCRKSSKFYSLQISLLVNFVVKRLKIIFLSKI